MIKHNIQNDRIYRRQDTESIIAEEFFDLTLEVAAYAKKHLEIARSIQEKAGPLPPLAHRAFLLAQEVDYFLNILEKHNFNVFE